MRWLSQVSIAGFAAASLVTLTHATLSGVGVGSGWFMLGVGLLLLSAVALIARHGVERLRPEQRTPNRHGPSCGGGGAERDRDRWR